MKSYLLRTAMVSTATLSAPSLLADSEPILLRNWAPPTSTGKSALSQGQRLPFVTLFSLSSTTALVVKAE